MRALYVGYTKDTENHGDEALMWIIRDLLAPELDVRPDWKEYEVALLGGGTLINQSPWLIDHFESTLNQARLGGLVLGTGVGDLSFWGNTFSRWVPLLQKCIAVGVRGPESERLLSTHGFINAEICGDPYMWLRPPVERARKTPRRLCVNFGSTNNSLWGTSDATLHETIYETLLILSRRGWSFVFLSVWSKDLPILQQMAARLIAEGADIPLVLDARTDTLECYSALAGCELFLGEKLHACAMAAVAGVPFIALEYQPKVRDFAESVDMHHWTLSTGKLDTPTLLAKVEELHTAREEVRVALLAKRDALRENLISFTQQAKAKLKQAAVMAQ